MRTGIRALCGRAGARTRARDALVLAVAAGLGGCGQEQSADPGSPRVAVGGTAVIAGPVDLGGLNPLVAVEATTQEFVRDALFLPLVRMGPDMAPVPALAESWELDGDTMVTFVLREDVRWHDGTPTTAQDVAFTFRAIKDPSTAFPDPVRFAAWDSVEVVNARTVRFHVRPHPDPLFGWTLTAIAPAHLLSEVAPGAMAQAPFNRSPVGNGPFRFASRRANDRVVFEANRGFAETLGGRPNLDRLIYRVIPESSARVAELVSGGVDLAFAYPIADLAQLVDGLRAVETDARQMSFVAWNARRPPLDDAGVREALSLAIDREEIVTVLRDGHGRAAVSPIPPSHWAFHPDLAPLPFDVARARELLAGAGLNDRDGDGVRERADGDPLRLELKFPGQDPNFRAAAEMIRSDLEAVGVDVRPVGLEGGTLIADVTGAERRFDAVMLSLEIDLRPNLRDFFHADGGSGPFHLSGYSDPELDAAIDALATEVDRERERAHWLRAQEILARDQPWTFLYYFPNLAGVSGRLRGVAMDVRGRLVNVAEWWVEGARPVAADAAGAAGAAGAADADAEPAGAPTGSGASAPAPAEAN